MLPAVEGIDGPVAVSTRADRLADELARDILSGTFEPGSRLDEISLAERYRVSRTPVREALRQLASSGLIEMQPRRGAFVAQMTSESLNELFVAMGEIEATCARLSAISMNPLERGRLKALHRDMGALALEGLEESYAEANVEFHMNIYRGAHNAVIEDMAMALRKRLNPYRRAQFQASGRLRASHEEHEQILAAILHGDAASAHAAMVDHVHSVGGAYESVRKD
ncbi:MAG: GntR family transcriptional regulator [Alphaproteobacteria bacterium]|nr:GntR family transcriptional regulator [Alphaproteobacteria bacterium]